MRLQSTSERRLPQFDSVLFSLGTQSEKKGVSASSASSVLGYSPRANFSDRELSDRASQHSGRLSCLSSAQEVRRTGLLSLYVNSARYSRYAGNPRPTYNSLRRRIGWSWGQSGHPETSPSPGDVYTRWASSVRARPTLH